MEKVDLVIVGAEGVVENGGIINKVGAPVAHTGPCSGRGSMADLGYPTRIMYYASFL